MESRLVCVLGPVQPESSLARFCPSCHQPHGQAVAGEPGALLHAAAAAVVDCMQGWHAGTAAAQYASILTDLALSRFRASFEPRKA